MFISAEDEFLYSKLIKYSYDNTFVLSFNYADQSFYDTLHKQKWADWKHEKKTQELSQMNSKNLITLLPIMKNLKALDSEQSNINEEAAFELVAALRCNNVLSQCG